jgi:indole-3-glycerol phosphate synthase
VGTFRDALARPGLQAIAEIKRKSPSAGELRPDADPAALARAFGGAGAAAISVLVDERFGGSIDDLRAARAATRTPLLAKGFFSEEDQIRELAQAGADAVLLILRDLDYSQLRNLCDFAEVLGLDTLVEAHDGEELERAVRLGADPIGINCRDLKSFEIDRDAQLELVTAAPSERVIVAESGILSRAQAAEAELCGAGAVLVGSALMRSPDPGAKLAELIARPLVKVCGLTCSEDVEAVAAAGADMAGFILAEESPRRAPGVLEVPETMLSVAVWVGERGQSGADLDQLYGLDEDHRSRDAVLYRGAKAVAEVLDLPWQRPDPDHLASAAAVARRRRVMLAGGLSPENVADAIAQVRPWAVDASSSLETAPGLKNHRRVREFVRAVEQASRTMSETRKKERS